MNTKATRAQFARQTEIRRLLRLEYRAGAANEMLVARLRHEMSHLPHRHELNSDKVCGWCFYGTDAYLQSWEQIEAETRESEAASDAVLAAALDTLTNPSDVTIEVVRTAHGDLMVHMDGCKDLTNSHHTDTNPDSTHAKVSAPTLAEAIRKSDEEWADAFGIDYPVTEENRSECWSIGWGSIQSAPCVMSAARAAKITWTENREPRVERDPQCQCPFNGRRRAHYDWCPKSAQSRRNARIAR